MEAEQEPVVSIVTPSYNSGRFLEETIQSVLSQDYAHIDYLVMDGGSTDGTREILERYRGRLRYVSERDRGQADAVNRGFRLSRGSVFAFLNADDTYLPGAISTVVRHMREHPEAGVVYGEGYHVTEAGEVINRYPTQVFDPEKFRRQCYICQPAAFLRREAFEAVGLLDAKLHYALDYDLWIRVAQRYPMVKVEEYLARSRMHRQNKTLRHLREVFREVFLVLRRHYGYVPSNWLYGYSAYLVSGEDPVFEVPRPSPANLGLCVLLGLYYNHRHPVQFLKDLLATARQTLACRHRS
ncbi:MAG TPA: glycosyltransferase family 2 protein [Bryobacteraceae bacterium]|nr:glycosyltransferase family 2 protein [Bryobacteraceae bacterium]